VYEVIDSHTRLHLIIHSVNMAGTYDHRLQDTEGPVCSPELKLLTGELVVWLETTCESSLSYVLPFFCRPQRRYSMDCSGTLALEDDMVAPWRWQRTAYTEKSSSCRNNLDVVRNSRFMIIS
jgi:hypothetical protein